MKVFSFFAGKELVTIIPYESFEQAKQYFDVFVMHHSEVNDWTMHKTTDKEFKRFFKMSDSQLAEFKRLSDIA